MSRCRPLSNAFWLRLAAALLLAALLVSCQATVADDTDAPLQPTPPPDIAQTLEALPTRPAIVAPLSQILRPTAAPEATAEGTGAP